MNIVMHDLIRIFAAVIVLGVVVAINYMFSHDNIITRTMRHHTVEN